jgi:two-component system sensor histidine kinase VicK
VIQQESDQVRKQIAKMQWYQDEDYELISVDSQNEVGMLAQEFNDMHHSLKVAVEKLINAEEQMTTIVDCLAEGLIVVNTSDKILYFNPAAKYLLNFDETSQFPNQFTDLLRTTNLTVLENTQGQDARATVEINLDKEGENRILRVVSSQFASAGVTISNEDTSNGNHKMAGMIYVFDDITREHEIDKMKSDFVALVSHELRTPLTSIIGFISLILDGKAGPLNEVQQQSLTRAHRQSHRQ